MEMCLSLMKIILVQSPDFKDDLDTDYIWVFISCYVNKHQICPSQVLGNFFHDDLKTPRQSRCQKLSKNETIVQT